MARKEAQTWLSVSARSGILWHVAAPYGFKIYCCHKWIRQSEFGYSGVIPLRPISQYGLR